MNSDPQRLGDISSIRDAMRQIKPGDFSCCRLT
jgi:hypothetical protein